MCLCILLVSSLEKKSSFVLAEADKMDWSFLTRQDVMRVCTLVAGLAALELLRKKFRCRVNTSFISSIDSDI